MVACPAHVTVFRYGIETTFEYRAFGHQPLETAGPESGVAIEVVEAHLIDDEDHEQFGLASSGLIERCGGCPTGVSLERAGDDGGNRRQQNKRCVSRRPSRRRPRPRSWSGAADVERISRASTVITFLSSSTMSASLPASSDPRSFSACAAYAAFQRERLRAPRRATAVPQASSRPRAAPADPAA